jgi:hypothetical protein
MNGCPLAPPRAVGVIAMERREHMYLIQPDIEAMVGDIEEAVSGIRVLQRARCNEDAERSVRRRTRKGALCRIPLPPGYLYKCRGESMQCRMSSALLQMRLTPANRPHNGARAAPDRAQRGAPAASDARTPVHRSRPCGNQ